MVKKSERGRKLILVRDDLLEGVRKITAREGKTVFSFTNEVFEQVLRVYDMDVSLSDVVEFYRLMQIERETGALIVPLSVLEYMTSVLFKGKRKELLEEWRRSGLWYGKYLCMRFPDEELLGLFERLMRFSLWNVTEFSVLRKEDGVKIRCMSPHFSSEHTEAFSKFLEGVLDALGYESVKNECLRGMILLEFRKKKKS